LTQLELTTLALASLNGITFVLWWDKPLGAQAVVRLYPNRRLTDQERDAEGVSDLFFSGVICCDQVCNRHSEISLSGLWHLPKSEKYLLALRLGFVISSYVGHKTIFLSIG
jgi:hypothetical protein